MREPNHLLVVMAVAGIVALGLGLAACVGTGAASRGASTYGVGGNNGDVSAGTEVDNSAGIVARVAANPDTEPGQDTSAPQVSVLAQGLDVEPLTTVSVTNYCEETGGTISTAEPMTTRLLDKPFVARKPPPLTSFLDSSPTHGGVTVDGWPSEITIEIAPEGGSGSLSVTCAPTFVRDAQLIGDDDNCLQGNRCEWQSVSVEWTKSCALICTNIPSPAPDREPSPSATSVVQPETATPEAPTSSPEPTEPITADEVDEITEAEIEDWMEVLCRRVGVLGFTSLALSQSHGLPTAEGCQTGLVGKIRDERQAAGDDQVARSRAALSVITELMGNLQPAIEELSAEMSGEDVFEARHVTPDELDRYADFADLPRPGPELNGIVERALEQSPLIPGIPVAHVLLAGAEQSEDRSDAVEAIKASNDWMRALFLHEELSQ